MNSLQATSYSLFASKKTISGLRAKTPRTATWYGATVLNEDGSILEVRRSWDIGKLFAWLESFGFDVSLDSHLV